MAEIYVPLAKFHVLGGVLSQGTVMLTPENDELAMALGPDYDRLTRILQGKEPSPIRSYVNAHGPKDAGIIHGSLGGMRFFHETAVQKWQAAGLTGAEFEPATETYSRLIVKGRSGDGTDISPRIFDDARDAITHNDYLWDQDSWSGDDIFTVGDSHRVWMTQRARKALKGLRVDCPFIHVVGVPSQKSDFPIGMSEAYDLGLT